METLVALLLMSILALAIYGVDRRISRGYHNKLRRGSLHASPFPAVISKADHWQRATSVVERSIKRASAISVNQALAARQLEAAEYAMHCLLVELSAVMKTSVTSPLREAAAHPSRPAMMPTAMAA